jgi:hypothetical protein
MKPSAREGRGWLAYHDRHRPLQLIGLAEYGDPKALAPGPLGEFLDFAFAADELVRLSSVSRRKPSKSPKWSKIRPATFPVNGRRASGFGLPGRSGSGMPSPVGEGKIDPGSPPNSSHVDLSGEQVIHALYGDDTIVFTVWTSEGPPPPDLPDPADLRRVVGRNGQIRVSGQYISAVVMLHRRSSDFFDVRDEADVPEDECWVEVIPAVSEEAVPVPESFFDGPNDRRWRYDRETERIERVK